MHLKCEYGRSKSYRTSDEGFTLVEILITSTILIIVIVGLIQLFIYCSILSESTGNLSVALTEGQAKIEEIRNHDYSLTSTDYASSGTPGNKFSLTQVTGKGVIYINSSNSDLLQVDIVVCWINNQNDRVIGEDLDLDGVLDAGEDVNGNGRFDSPVTLVTNIAKK